jgi:serine/threonine-protein kinase
MLSAVRRARSALGAADTAIVDLTEAPTLVTKLPAAPPPAPPAKPKPAEKAKPEGQPERMRRRALVFAAIAAVVLLVAGVTGWVLARAGTGPIATPKLVGLSATDAARVAEEAGLQVTTGQPVNSDTVAAGLVATQDPAEGTELEEGAFVTIRLSAGVRMVAVPDVRGKTEIEARGLLTKADLKLGPVTREYSETVAKGRIIRASQPADARVAHGTAISVVVSEGPPPVDVPAVETCALPISSATWAAASISSPRRRCARRHCRDSRWRQRLHRRT